jgi:hypothetical protein
MRISQYAYFTVRSERTAAHHITGRLGIEPDEIQVRGSRSVVPVLPRYHAWEIVCRDRDLRIDEQIDRIVARLAPHADQIAALVAEIDGPGDRSTATLQLVRYLDDDGGETEDLGPQDGELVKIPGQHQLLGWHLDRRTLEFLCYIGADLDADEYG